MEGALTLCECAVVARRSFSFVVSEVFDDLPGNRPRLPDRVR